jgi:hypothetical protein
MHPNNSSSSKIRCNNNHNSSRSRSSAFFLAKRQPLPSGQPILLGQVYRICGGRHALLESRSVAVSNPVESLITYKLCKLNKKIILSTDNERRLSIVVFFSLVFKIQALEYQLRCLVLGGIIVTHQQTCLPCKASIRAWGLVYPKARVHSKPVVFNTTYE